jgi:hypothetical protein
VIDAVFKDKFSSRILDIVELLVEEFRINGLKYILMR